MKRGEGMDRLLGSVLVFVSLAGIVCGMTLLFLGMRAVMEIGGSCADGGPYVAARPCPEGVPLAMIGGIFGGVLCLLIYLRQTWNRSVRGFAVLAWPALFLSLGWNFLEFGLDPPGEGGPAWGWLVCAIVFAAMGGAPLAFAPRAIALSLLPFDRGGKTSSFQAGGRPAVETARHGTRVHRFDSDGGEVVGATLVEALERLSRLREQGRLSDEEFEAAKRRVLGGER